MNLDRWDVCGVAGAGLLVAGAGLIYLPLALVLAGLMLALAGLLGARHEIRDRIRELAEQQERGR